MGGTGSRPNSTWWRKCEVREELRRLLSLVKLVVVPFPMTTMTRGGTGLWGVGIKYVNSDMPNTSPRK